MSNLSSELHRLATLKPPELRAKWREVYRSVAPDPGPDLLRRGIAYRLQERGQGRLASSNRRELDRLIKLFGNDDGALVASAPPLKPGTRLVRSWHGKTHQLRALFMAMDVRVQLQENTIEITLRKSSDNEPTTLSVPAGLVRRGNEVRVALAPNESSATSTPDPTLIRLMAQAFAARDHLLSGKDAPLIAKYDQRHQQRLARLSWLAPDIVSAILGGTQPVQLTARHLIRCATVPLEWQQQREFLGFAQG